MVTIKEIARRRFASQNKEAEKRGFKPLPFQIYLSLIQASFDSGFICPYCKVQMKIVDVKPYYFVASIDHKIPLDAGGAHVAENMIVVCNKCNIIKGTMTEDTFKKLLSLLAKDPFLKEKMFDEMWRGRFANKIGRENKDKLECPQCGWVSDIPERVGE